MTRKEMFGVSLWLPRYALGAGPGDNVSSCHLEIYELEIPASGLAFNPPWSRNVGASTDLCQIA